MTNVAAIFDRRAEAEFAYAALLRDGFTKDDISLLLSEEAKNTFFGSAAPTNELADEGAGGAFAGAGLGAIATGLALSGALLIPGVNVFAIGPMAAVLSGAGAGAVVGGLSGLIDADLQADKKRYDEALKAGKAVLIVHTASDAERSRAHAVFNEGIARRSAA